MYVYVYVFGHVMLQLGGFYIWTFGYQMVRNSAKKLQAQEALSLAIEDANVRSQLLDSNLQDFLPIRDDPESQSNVSCIKLSAIIPFLFVHPISSAQVPKNFTCRMEQ